MNGSGTFSPAEQRVVDAYAYGRQVDLPLDESDRVVRADVLARLLTGRVELPSDACPALKVTGARITGELDLEGATITAAIQLEQCLFEEAPNFGDAVAKSVRLPGCHLPGLRANGLRTHGNLELNGGFVATGEVQLLGARIGGSVRLSDATLHNPGGRALYASRITVEGAVLAARLVADGQVRVISARIAGLLSLRAARLSHGEGACLYAERLDVGESIFFQEGFRSIGEVVLQNASVKFGIDGAKASFACGPGKTCLNLERARVGNNVTFRSALIGGDVRMVAATVGATVNFADATFSGEGDQVNLHRLTAARAQLRFARPPGELDLSQAKLDVVEDDPESWPAAVTLIGCVYRAIETTRTTPVHRRISWVGRDPSGYRPQPYQQLSAAYRDAGEEQHAKRVSLENQRRRRATLARPARVIGWILDVTVGYGYRTWLAGLWLLLFLALGSAVYAIWPAAQIEAGKGPAFQPVAYALDLLLPIVELGQEKAWRAPGAGQWLAWGLILVGWSLTTAVVAGLGRLFNRS